MDLMSGEADPSEISAAERNSAASPLPGRVTFNVSNSIRILNLYGRMVADGEVARLRHRFSERRAVFSVFRRPPRCRLSHRRKIRGWRASRAPTSVISASGLILRRGHELESRAAGDRPQAGGGLVL